MPAYCATAQPHPWSTSELVLSQIADPRPHQTSQSQPTVLLWDPRPSRRQFVARLIAECGVSLRCSNEVSAIAHIECSGVCTFAVVALGACPSLDDIGLETIRGLKRRGVRVLCYEDGTQSWPLSIRCQLLLAGSSWLLDSTQAEFAQELRRLLGSALHEVEGEKKGRRKAQSQTCNAGAGECRGESPAMLAVFHTVCCVSARSATCRS